jgi:hypothetical protein
LIYIYLKLSEVYCYWYHMYSVLSFTCWSDQEYLNKERGETLYCNQHVPHSLSAYSHYHCIPTCTFHIPCQHNDPLIVFLPVHSTFLVSILTLIVFLPVHSTFLVSILTLSLYSYLYIQHSLSAYWHSHCIPTCTFNIPCQHTDTSIVFLPVHSTFLVSILTLSLYSYLYIQNSL